MMEEKLYKIGRAMLILMYLGEDKVTLILLKVHEGVHVLATSGELH